jgi:hypothetical protein
MKIALAKHFDSAFQASTAKEQGREVPLTENVIKEKKVKAIPVTVLGGL